MKRAVMVVVSLFIAQLASAAPHTVLVLRSEGTADTSSRTSIDTHVLRLAKNIDGKIDAGDITLTEAAAAVGCNSTEATCRDDVLATMGVDEIVTTTVTATPTGLNVTVRRITRGSAPKVAATTIPGGKNPDTKLNADIGPLFGVSAVATGPLADRPAQTPPRSEPKPTPPPPPAKTEPAKTEAQPVAAADPGTPPLDSNVTAAPNGDISPPAEGRPRRRMQMIGMGVGGGLVLLGVLMWSQASSVQNQIDAAEEPRSPTDFKNLRELEQRGDDQAGAGNLFFLAGAAIGGVSAYFYWRAGRSTSSRTARVTPTVFPNGAGVTLTLGGAR